MEENASCTYESDLIHQISACLLPVIQYPTSTGPSIVDHAVLNSPPRDL
jgi:hypothetical protein